MLPQAAHEPHEGSGVALTLNTLRDLPDMEALEDAGLLSRDRLLAADFPLERDAAEEESDELEDSTLEVEARVATEDD